LDKENEMGGERRTGNSEKEKKEERKETRKRVTRKKAKVG